MLLTLDLATHTGWSYGAPDDPKFKFGVREFAKTGDNIGRFIGEYDEWLTAALDRGVTATVFERPLIPRMTSFGTVRKLMALASHTEFLCFRKGIDVSEVNGATLKKFMTGDGRAKKPQMIAAAQRMGFDCKDDNAADAIAIRMYVVALKYPQYAGKFQFAVGPLFGEKHDHFNLPAN
jgi:hypothetical protein